MRPIGSLSDEKQARRFGDYLLAIGIANQVDPSREGWVIWVRDDGNVKRASADFLGFQANAEDPRFDRARRAGAIRREADLENEERRRRIITPRHEWHADTGARLGGARRMPWKRSIVTLALIAVSVGVTLLTALGEDRGPLMNALLIAPVEYVGDTVRWDGLAAIAHGQAWRLVTPIFLHFGFLHILFNMWWLRDFGMLIEPARGSLVFGALVLAIAVVSNLAQYAWSGPLAGGMSGVIYGLFGYLWVKGRVEPWGALRVSKGTAVVLLIWLIYCMTGMAGNIGNAAHVSGLVAGAALAWLPWRWRRLRHGPDNVVRMK